MSLLTCLQLGFGGTAFRDPDLAPISFTEKSKWIKTAGEVSARPNNFRREAYYRSDSPKRWSAGFVSRRQLDLALNGVPDVLKCQSKVIGVMSPVTD